MEILEERRSASVEELSVALGISKVSIRTYLDRLEEEGLLVRMRGGAAIPGRNQFELAFAARERINIQEKRAIAAAAADLIQDGESVVLDASTTSLQLARLLKRRQSLTVVTNGIYTALELAACHKITVLLVGGIVRDPADSLVGPQALEMISHLHVDRGFFSARGLSWEAGLTDPSIHEVQVRRAMVAVSKEVTALVDHSKLGEVSFASFAPIEALHRVITDDRAPEEFVQQFRDRGVNVVVCRADRKPATKNTTTGIADVAER